MEYLGDNYDGKKNEEAGESGEASESLERAQQGTSLSSSNNIPKKPEDRCNAIRFSDICKLFEKVSKIQGSAAKLKLLFNKELKQHLQGQSVFPLLRLILPANDTERGKYGLKQASIAKMYVKALSLNQDSEDAKRLLNWKDQSKTGVELSKLIPGEFGTILESVLKERIRSEESNATLAEVNKLLDDLANAITVDDKTNIMRHRVLDHFNAVEQKWLVRIIFQDLKIGLKHEAVLRYFYPTALRRYNECTNLRTVCEEEGLVSELVGIQLFVNFSPMLAKGFQNSTIGQVNAVINAMDKNPFAMDLKLDGERILCHIGEDNSFTLYTRKGNDYTDHYWPVVHNIISGLRTKTGKNFSCILDGEIIAIDGATKDFIPFGNNLTVAKKEREYGDDKQSRTDWHTDLPSWMSFYAFDIVYLDGDGSEELIRNAYQSFGIEAPSTIITGEITNMNLAIRRKLLTSILATEPYRVEIVPHRYVISNDIQERKNQLEAYFNEVTLAGKEGLVIKNLNSKYELGEKSRGFGHWVKMKPEYGDHAEDLDLLILGAYYGEGHSVRGEGISTFLLGVKDDRDPSMYQTVCKVGTGYNFQELQSLREKLKDITHPWDEGKASSSSASSQLLSNGGPEFLSHWKITKRDDRPHVYFLPEESFVMQLKCAEIVESNAFSCGYTCRFPRVQKIRYDKGYRDILSVSDIVAAKNKPRNIVTQSPAQDDTGTGHGNRRQKKTQQKTDDHQHRRMNPIDDQFRIQSIVKKTINVDGHIFAGSTFCVMGTDFQYQPYEDRIQGIVGSEIRKFTRDQIMTEIKKQEGEVIANASFPNCVVVAGSARTLQLKNLIEQGEKDVIDFSYIIDCLDAGYRLPLRGFYYLNISPTTRKSMEGLIDPFGDSFIDDVIPAELTKVLQNVDDTIAKLERKSHPIGTKRKASSHEVEVTLLEKQLLQEWNRNIKGKCWRSLTSTYFVEEEREAFYHPINCTYQEGIIIYLDIFTSLGSCDAEPTAYFQCKALFEKNELLDTKQINSMDLETMKCLYYRMKARGAIFTDNLHGAVTHIVVARGSHYLEDRLQLLHDRIRVLRKLDSHNFEKRIVDYTWMEACLEESGIVDPRPEHLIKMPHSFTTAVTRL